MGLGRHARQHPVEARLLALGRQAVQGTVHGADDLAGVNLASRGAGTISSLGSAKDLLADILPQLKCKF